MDFGFRLDEDVAACAAPFVSFRAQEGRHGDEVADEAAGYSLQGTLGAAGCSRPAALAQLPDGGSVGNRVYSEETFREVGAFAQRLGFGGGFFCLRAEVGIKAHDAGEAVGRVVVDSAGGAEEGIAGVGSGELGVVE